MRTSKTVRFVAFAALFFWSCSAVAQSAPDWLLRLKLATLEALSNPACFAERVTAPHIYLLGVHEGNEVLTLAESKSLISKIESYLSQSANTRFQSAATFITIATSSSSISERRVNELKGLIEDASDADITIVALPLARSGNIVDMSFEIWIRDGDGPLRGPVCTPSVRVSYEAEGAEYGSKSAPGLNSGSQGSYEIRLDQALEARDPDTIHALVREGLRSDNSRYRARALRAFFTMNREFIVNFDLPDWLKPKLAHAQQTNQWRGVLGLGLINLMSATGGVLNFRNDIAAVDQAEAKVWSIKNRVDDYYSGAFQVTGSGVTFSVQLAVGNRDRCTLKMRIESDERLAGLGNCQKPSGGYGYVEFPIEIAIQ